jgi:pimeloyl-ACP methyl ester carboxylesterase
VHVEVHGDGPPLLLIAGLGQGSWVWRDVVPLLAGRRRVLVYDHRGTGLSPGPARTSIADLARDAEAVLPGAADVVGFSMGGYVALTLALGKPELVRSLVLAGTSAGGPARVPRPAHVRDAFEEAARLPLDEFARRTLPYTLSPGWVEQNPERFEAILAARLEHPTPYETIEAHVAACYRFYEAAVEVERVGQRALVVHGDADLIVPVENGRALAARLPNADYVELPGRGHNLMLEEPALLAGLVERVLEGYDPAGRKNEVARWASIMSPWTLSLPVM